MERFVFIVAVTFAVLFGIVAVFGGSHINWGDVDFDGAGGAAPVVQTTAGRLEAQAYQGEGLTLKHLAAIVTITPEDRTDYLVEIDSPGGTPMPTVSASEGRVTVDGQLRGRISQCREDGTASLRGYDEIGVANLPRINIRAPRTLSVTRGGAGSTQIAASEALTLDLYGCGAVTVGDVANEFNVQIDGTGDVTGSAARRLVADVDGAGDIVMGAISEAANLDIDGVGAIRLASLNGDLSVDANGTGEVDIRGGALGEARLDLNGMGDVNIAAPVRSLKVSIAGVGDVDVAGVVGDLDADITGPGSVTVQALTGSLRQDIAGPGSVRVRGRGPGAVETPANAP